MIPGSNLLAQALTVINPQEFAYFVFAARITNSIGLDVPVYNAALDLQGSVQPVPRTMYQIMGLDFQKNYNVFFIEQNVVDVARDVSGDQIVFSGKTYQCVSKTDWFQQDGWDAVLAVQVQNTPLSTGITLPDNGNYETGDNLSFTVPYTLAVAVTGVPRLALTIGTHTRYANYISGSGTLALLFGYNVVAEDSAPDGISMERLIDLNGGSILSTASPAVPANTGLQSADLSGVIVNA